MSHISCLRYCLREITDWRDRGQKIKTASKSVLITNTWSALQKGKFRTQHSSRSAAILQEDVNTTLLAPCFSGQHRQQLIACSTKKKCIVKPKSLYHSFPIFLSICNFQEKEEGLLIPLALVDKREKRNIHTATPSLGKKHNQEIVKRQVATCLDVFATRKKMKSHWQVTNIG